MLLSPTAQEVKERTRHAMKDSRREKARGSQANSHSCELSTRVARGPPQHPKLLDTVLLGDEGIHAVLSKNTPSAAE